ncbi:hypothetical protein Tco_0099482 [Tanacetum coccineum]
MMNAVLEIPLKVKSSASAPRNKDAKSHKTTKRYMPVEKSSASKKPERQIPTGHRFSNKKTTTVPEKTRTPRSCLRWQPTGRILKTVCLRWVPTGRLFNSCTSKVENEPTHGSNVDIPHIHACKQTLGLSAGTSFNGQKQQRIDLNADALYNEKQENLRVWLLKFLISKKPVPECSGLVLHQMTSDHNRSELGIQDHSNEPSSSKLVPKVVPLAVKTATSRQELELLFHFHIAMLRTTEAQRVPTEISADTSDKISMIAILTDLQTKLDGHAKDNQEICLENETLKNELLQCKQEIYRLDTQKVKLDLENKVRQEQALVIQRNKRNAELEQENVLLKSALSVKDKSITLLQSEKEKILSEKKELADSYLDEIVCLKNANKVARDMLQRFNMPTQTIPMLSKKPKKATDDLHKDILGTRNPGLGYMAKRAQPVLYDADTLFHPTHHPVSIWDSEDVVVHQVVSMKKMNEKPGHVRPASDFYDKLNALMFVPQKELSGDQVYWLSANEIASQASKPATPATPFVHKSPPPSQVLANLQKVNAVFHQFEGIINERTTQKPLYVSEWCFDYAKQFVEQQLVPFYEHFKNHIQSANETIFREVKEYEQIFDDLDAEYERCVLDNKNLTIEKKNLLIKNDCLIAECLEKDICSIVLTSDIVVPPSSNCLCEDLRSACDREHTKVLELEAEVLKQQKMVIESEKRNSHLQKTHIDLQLKFQNYKQCIDTSSASNAIFEINKLRKQLQGKDDTIRNLDAQISIMKVLNVGSTEGRKLCSLKRWYNELSKANTHSRTAYTEKLSAVTSENTKLKALVHGKTSSGPSAFEKPKVLATNSSKYVPPPKRANWVKPTPLPKKKQVTFQEPPRTSNRPTQKPPVQQNKKPNVPVNLSTRTKPATESRKPMPKSHTRNHRILPSKSVNARRAADHNRKLNFVDHNQFVIRSLKSVNTKTPQAKHSVNHTKKVWNATRNHNVNTTKTTWRPTGKVVGSVKPQWKPTGRHFALYDNCPLTRIMEPIVEPLELTPSVSSSSKVTMISRFTDCKLSDRKAGSKGLSGIFEC